MSTPQSNAMFAGFVAFALFPIYWALLTSFTPDAQIYAPAREIRLFPKNVSLEQYRYLFKETIFLTWFANSCIVSTLVTALSSVFSVLAAYSIARLRFRGSQITMAGIFVCYLVPPSLLFIPLAMVLYNVACIYSLAGEKQRGLEALERSVRNGLSHRGWILHDSNLDALRDDPRFASILALLADPG